MRQETLSRGLLDCLCDLGWVPWVLGLRQHEDGHQWPRRTGQPLWTPALRQLAGECRLPSRSLRPGRGNQKGAVESLVKWVKGNFLPVGRFADDADLRDQSREWVAGNRTRDCEATGVPPLARLPAEATGGELPGTAQDYGLPAASSPRGAGPSLQQRLLGAGGPRRRPSPPGCIDAASACAPADEIARHHRAPDGARQRVVDPRTSPRSSPRNLGLRRCSTGRH